MAEQLPPHFFTRRVTKLEVSDSLFDTDGNHVGGKLNATVEDVDYGEHRGPEAPALVVKLENTPRDPDQQRCGVDWDKSQYGVGGYPLMDPDDLQITIPVELLNELLAEYR